jgi:hypothetical protein
MTTVRIYTIPSRTTLPDSPPLPIRKSNAVFGVSTYVTLCGGFTSEMGQRMGHVQLPSRSPYLRGRSTLHTCNDAARRASPSSLSCRALLVRNDCLTLSRTRLSSSTSYHNFKRGSFGDVMPMAFASASVSRARNRPGGAPEDDDRTPSTTSSTMRALSSSVAK